LFKEGRDVFKGSKAEQEIIVLGDDLVGLFFLVFDDQLQV
jgi:hypothetical protein